ncbi:hypothetical protein MesoLj113b_45650 [Mesorhizobium sp. 113-3-3]|nr:hypothetical protein MesoLj113b_45650 [Mesorhizobium sp. 113-3-3]
MTSATKAKNLDPTSLKDQGFLSNLFSSFKARLERFKEKYEDVAGQIDRIGLELDRHKDTLRRDIAVLDDLHEQTKDSIVKLDAYVQAGKKFVEDYRTNELPKPKAVADSTGGDVGGTLEAQTYQDAVQALDRLERRNPLPPADRLFRASDPAVARLPEALTSPKLQHLAWSKHGFRGPLGTGAGDADAIAGVRPAEIEAVLPMPSADVLLALLDQTDG